MTLAAEVRSPIDLLAAWIESQMAYSALLCPRLLWLLCGTSDKEL